MVIRVHLTDIRRILESTAAAVAPIVDNTRHALTPIILILELPVYRPTSQVEKRRWWSCHFALHWMLLHQVWFDWLIQLEDFLRLEEIRREIGEVVLGIQGRSRQLGGVGLSVSWFLRPAVIGNEGLIRGIIRGGVVYRGWIGGEGTDAFERGAGTVGWN